MRPRLGRSLSDIQAEQAARETMIAHFVSCLPDSIDIGDERAVVSELVKPGNIAGYRLTDIDACLDAVIAQARANRQHRSLSFASVFLILAAGIAVNLIAGPQWSPSMIPSPSASTLLASY